MSTSPEPLSEDDLDLLADYSEALLDEAGATRVAHLIATDERWAITHRLLVGSVHQVDQALDAYAKATPTLPDEVAQDISATLRRLTEGQAQEHAPASLDEARRARQTRKARSKPFSSRLWLSAAAAVIVAMCFGLGSFALRAGDSDKDSTAQSGASVTQKAPAAELSGVAITRSGANYTKANLGSDVHAPAAVGTRGPSEGMSAPQPAPAASVDPDLARLSGRGALSACLSAIVALHAGAAVAVDFARYDSRPALIITLANPSLRVAVGGDCGLPNSGADELAAAATR